MESWIAIAEKFGISVVMLIGVTWGIVKMFNWMANDMMGQIKKNEERIESIVIKLIDNSSRDVFFAYANEIARACDAIGLDASEVINRGKLGYDRTGLAKPGLVGGPCLYKDPYIFSQSINKYGISYLDFQKKGLERQICAPIYNILLYLYSIEYM